jgi:tetraacyldisaccharide 4'-kinase
LFTFSAAKVYKFLSVLSFQMQQLRFLLFPFSIIYIGVTELRNLLFSMGILKQREFKLPVIVVGNLSTGGTGKSPLIDYLLKLLTVTSMPASLSRGYGRKSTGFQEVNLMSKSWMVGDEPLMLKQLNPNAGVFVDADRVNGLEIINSKRPEFNVFLLDDAFQHRKLKPGLAILLTTFDSPFFSDFVLPTGNLREMRKNANRAQVIIVTKCPPLKAPEMDIYRAKIQKYSNAKVFFSGIRYAEPVSLFGHDYFSTQANNALVLTGIANAQSLLHYCKSKYQLVNHLGFGDHHSYKASDFTQLTDNFNSFATEKKIVLTTQKDAVKLLEADEKSLDIIKNLPIFYQPIQMEIHGNQNEFNELILNYVRSTQPNC